MVVAMALVRVAVMIRKNYLFVCLVVLVVLVFVLKILDHIPKSRTQTNKR